MELFIVKQNIQRHDFHYENAYIDDTNISYHYTQSGAEAGVAKAIDSMVERYSKGLGDDDVNQDSLQKAIDKVRSNKDVFYEGPVWSGEDYEDDGVEMPVYFIHRQELLD